MPVRLFSPILGNVRLKRHGRGRPDRGRSFAL